MNKTEGRALPQGAIVGAIPRFALDELSNFAGLLVGGCSKLGVSNLIFVVSPFSHIDDLCAADRPESLQWRSWCLASTRGFVQADIRASAEGGLQSHISLLWANQMLPVRLKEGKNKQVCIEDM